jgi:hypothetical protein
MGRNEDDGKEVRLLPLYFNYIIIILYYERKLHYAWVMTSIKQYNLRGFIVGITDGSYL